MSEALDSSAEQALRERLRQRAAMAEPSPHARAALQRRLEQPRPSAVRRRIAVAAAAAVAGVGVLTQTTSPVIVTADGGSGDATTRGSTAPATTAPAPVAPRTLPRLVLADERFVVAHIEEHTSDPSIGPTGEIHTQVFRPASGGPASPALTVRSIAAGAAYGIGEEAPEEVTERVDVNGRVGFLVDGESLSPSLGIRLDDGSAVHLKGIGIPGEALVEVARGMRRRSASPGWDVPVGSMSPAVEGEVRYGGSRSSEIQYAAGSRHRADVRLFEGDRIRFEDIVLDRADAAVTYEPIDIRGHPGVLFGTGDSFVALWYEDGIVGELVLTLDRPAALAGIASLREITEDEWRAMADGPEAPEDE